MFYLSGFNVKLTRGDSATLCVDLKDTSGEPYIISDGDELVLTIKRDANTAEALITKQGDSSGMFTFLPSDTSSMEYGSYKYDIQLTTEGGEVYTVIPVSNFTIMEEVTWSAGAGE